MLAVLAFLALRPHKGWLRRKAAAAPALEEGGKPAPEPDGSPEIDTFALDSRPGDNDPKIDTLLPSTCSSGGGPAAAVGMLDAQPCLPSLPSLPAAPWAADALGPDALLPYSGPSVDALTGMREPAPTAPETPPLSSISPADAGLSQQPGMRALPLSYISSAGLGAAGGVTVAPPASGDATGLQTASRSSG